MHNIKDIRNDFDYFKNQKITYGYSDHSHFGFSEDFLSLMPYVLEKKISYFEKHICKKISKSTPDYISSLNTRDFITLISAEIHCPGKKYSKDGLWHFVANGLPKKSRASISLISFIESSKLGAEAIFIMPSRSFLP